MLHTSVRCLSISCLPRVRQMVPTADSQTWQGCACTENSIMYRRKHGTKQNNMEECVMEVCVQIARCGDSSPYTGLLWKTDAIGQKSSQGGDLYIVMEHQETGPSEMWLLKTHVTSTADHALDCRADFPSFNRWSIECVDKFSGMSNGIRNGAKDCTWF